MAVTLYSTGCPKCRVLTSKLDAKNIKYSVNSDQEEMINKGFMSVPQLEVNGHIFDFNKARKLVDSFDNSQSFESYAMSTENE